MLEVEEACNVDTGGHSGQGAATTARICSKESGRGEEEC